MQRKLARMNTLAKSLANTHAPGVAATDSLTIRTREGRALVLRRIRRGDVAALQRGFTGLSPEEVRMRFLHPLTELPREFARRLCDLDPHLAVAWVLADPDGTANAQIHAVARVHLDPVTEQAEFALAVQRAIAGQGFGRMLLRRAIESAAELGAIEVWGDVHTDNAAMLHLCEAIGCHRSPVAHDPGVVRMRMDLIGTA